MATLKTTFAGLELRNPIIVSSSGLTDSAEKNQKFYEAGVGAIVLKSLFEEQIMMEADWLGDPNMYPEGSDYLVEYVRQHKLSEYLELIKETKKVCPIPVIASINCYQDAEWVGFAQQMEKLIFWRYKQVFSTITVHLNNVILIFSATSKRQFAFRSL